MSVIEAYLVKNFRSDKPDRLALIMMLIYAFMLLTRRKEVFMSHAKELDQNKEGKTPLKQKASKFVDKMKDTLSSDNAKIAYSTLGVTAVISGIVIAIQTSLTTAAICLMAGGAIAGSLSFYRLRISKSSDPVPA